MKKYLLYLTTAFLTTHFATAQVLYTENFNNLSVGNIGTDITGQAPGQGGWYTFGGVNTGNNFVTNADFQIVPETGRGNVLTIEAPNTSYLISVHRLVFRTDVETIWSQRTVGNDIFKLSFDVYTGKIVSAIKNFDNFISIKGTKGNIVNLCWDGKSKALSINTSNRSTLAEQCGDYIATLPTDSWVAIELYIDYTANKFYVRIPSLNISYAYDSDSPLFLTDSPGSEDSVVNHTPHFLGIRVRGGSLVTDTAYEKLRYDNINISATNTAPTVSVKEFISDKFTIFPNPAADIITISNSENIGIEKVEVYDLAGRTLQTKKYNNENNVQLNLSDFATATYLLHIQTKEGVSVKKIVKQ